MIRIADVQSLPVGAVSCDGDPGEGPTCGNGLEKIYPSAVVRYGFLKHIGEFGYKPNMKFTCGGRVIIQTDRGIELGTQVSLTCTGCSKSISRDQMRAYAENSGESYLNSRRGKILRQATPEDLHEEARMGAQVAEKLVRCRTLLREQQLPMKVVDCEHVLGGERIIFYFMSDSRIDFRRLVKDLAQEYHTRIEMRQVGARDEARILADYETCGQECCCKTFLKTLKPISMRMAKLQKATLDPTKVSGRCGRLKCCLRYEHESYEELARKLPKIGKMIRTTQGNGIVVDRQILTQLVQIELDDRKRVTVVVEDILPPEEEVRTPPPEPQAKAQPGRADRAPDQAKKPESAPKRKRRRRSRRGGGKGSGNPNASTGSGDSA